MGKPTTRQRLRLRVKAAAESRLRAGHPWLYVDSIVDQNRAGEPGELAAVYDRRNRFLALGLYDPDSPLRLRVLLRGQPQPLDDAWWATRLEQALQRRAGLFDQKTTGFRWINGESDQWPGLVLDCYAEALVLKLYTSAWMPRLPTLKPLLEYRLRPRMLVLRLSRNIQRSAADKFGLADGMSLLGPSPVGPVVFLESGLRFEADIVRGQKTGFFLDQRENRQRVESLAKGRTVLNAFSFSGGFSVYAARGGARAVTDVDISAHALAAAARNFELNSSLASVAACRREAIQADAFEWLETNQSRQYGLVILDPPSLAKREKERAGAIRAYGRLASLGCAHLERGGVLVAGSCSAHVSAEEFFSAVRGAIAACGRQAETLDTRGHPADHPANLPEAQYLKAIYLRLKNGAGDERPRPGFRTTC